MSIKMRVLMVVVMSGLFAGVAQGGTVAATPYGDEIPFGALDANVPASTELGLTANEFLSDGEAATQEDGPAPEFVRTAQGVWMRVPGDPDAPWINVSEQFGISEDQLSGLTPSEIAAKVKGFTTSSASTEKQDEGQYRTPGFTAGRMSSLSGGGIGASDNRYSRLVQLSGLSGHDDSWLYDNHSNSSHISSLSAQSCPGSVNSGGTSQYQLGSSGGSSGGDFYSDSDYSNQLALLPAQSDNGNQDQTLPENPIVTDPTLPDETPMLMAPLAANGAKPVVVGLPAGGPSAVPEPVTMSLLSVAVMGLLLRRKR